MPETLDEFREYREKINEKILASGNTQIQRFFNLDTRAYEPGALPTKTKELLGLVASTVLRCDDCVTYHVKNASALRTAIRKTIELNNRVSKSA